MTVHKKSKQKDSAKKSEPKADSSKDTLNLEDVDHGLQAIYGDEEDTDFSKLEQRTRSLSSILGKIVILLGTLSVVTWAAYFAYIQISGPAEAPNAISTSLTLSEDVRSGDSDTLVFTYENPRKSPLANLSVRAQLSEYFVITGSNPSPVDPELLEWNLGSIDAFGSGEISLEGYWVSPVPSVQPVQFISTYRPANFNAEFSEVTSAQLSFEESIALIEIDGSETLASGEDGEFTVRVRNTSSIDLPTSELVLELPDAFFLESASPTLSRDLPPTWTIDELPAGGESEFTFDGTVSSGSGGFTPFTASLSFILDEQSLLQDTVTHTVDVPAGDIGFSISVNGSQSQVSAAPGDTLNTTLIIENKTDAQISGAQVLMDFRADNRMPVNWSSFDYDGGTLTSDGVLWDTSEIGNLAPGERIILTPSFRLNSTLRDDDSTRLDFLVHLLRNGADLQSDVFSVYIGDQASLSADLREGDTSHTLSITLTPPPQPLEDILISLDLPAGTDVIDPSLPVGTSAVLPSVNAWKWRIPTLPSNSGSVRAELELINLPTDWSGSVELRAIDPNTLEEISLSSPVSSIEE